MIERTGPELDADFRRTEPRCRSGPNIYGVGGAALGLGLGITTLITGGSGIPSSAMRWPDSVPMRWPDNTFMLWPS